MDRPRRQRASASAAPSASASAAQSASAKKRVAQASAAPPAKKQKAPIPGTPAAAANAGQWTSPVVDAGGASRTGSFTALVSDTVPPHTLLLGTQPSNVSLNHGWYFGSDENAFWHIVGSALGFRRGFHVNAARGCVIPSISKHLSADLVEVPTYLEAVERLQRAGYALWDIFESSERKSAKTGKKTSMDGDITKAKPAPIEAFVRAYPSIKRLVFVTGSGSASKFEKHFDEWLSSGSFVTANAKAAQVFGAHKRHPIPPKATSGKKGAGGAIELIVPPSVSPAAARFDGDFAQKRQGWMADVFNGFGSV